MMVEPSTLWKKSRPDKSEFWHVKDLHVIQAQAIAIPIIAAGTQVSQEILHSNIVTDLCL